MTIDKQDVLNGLLSDPNLNDLEELLQQPRSFNILSLLGLGRQELRHSNLLALLLDPNQSHRLGNSFVRALLQFVMNLLPQVLDIDTLKLEELKVQREWNFIDILIESQADKLVIIIENKIDTSEHSNQLDRYYKLVHSSHPGWQIVGVYLTLDGESPASASDRDHYVPLGYSDIAAIVTNLYSNLQLSSDVQIFLRHYVQFIRSDLVPELNTGQAALGRKLYMDHRTALDAIFQARDARMWMIQRHFQSLFSVTKRELPLLLQLDKYHTNNVLPRWHTRFAPMEWYRQELETSTAWTKTGLVLVFEFMHSPQQIHLSLTVGPPDKKKHLRNELYDLALRQAGGLSPAWNEPSNDWFSIYTREILSDESNYFADASDDTIRIAITDHWRAFLSNDLPGIMNALRSSILSQQP